MKLMPYSQIFCFVLLLLILNSCGIPSDEKTPQPEPSPTVLASRTQIYTPILTNTQPIPTTTTAPPTAENTQTQIPPVTSTKDLSKFNMPDTITIGSLWIYFEDQGEYHIYDFVTESFSTVKAPPLDCDKTPLLNSLDVICQSDGHASIYNLQSEVRTALPIEEADYIWQQPSISELLFYLKRDTSPIGYYYSYNLSSGESKSLITLPHEGFETLPLFSYSVDYAVAVINNEVIKIDLGTGEYTTMFSGNERATFDTAWSPTLPVVVFGARDDLWQEIGERANLIYLLEPETGIVEQLFPNEEQESYFEEDGWPIWSPMGDEFIARSFIQLFVIGVNGEVLTIQSETSTGEVRDYRFGSIQWSPDGEYIAFIEYPNGYSENNNLLIYLKDENVLVKVIENERMSSIFWR